MFKYVNTPTYATLIHPALLSNLHNFSNWLTYMLLIEFTVITRINWATWFILVWLHNPFYPDKHIVHFSMKATYSLLLWQALCPFYSIGHSGHFTYKKHCPFYPDSHFASLSIPDTLICSPVWESIKCTRTFSPPHSVGYPPVISLSIPFFPDISVSWSPLLW